MGANKPHDGVPDPPGETVMGANWAGECNIIGCRAPMVRKVGNRWMYCEPHAREQEKKWPEPLSPTRDKATEGDGDV